MYPPKNLSASERSGIGRELSRAQSALERARKMAEVGGDQMLAKDIDIQLREVGKSILLVHGTTRASMAELIA